MPRDFAFIQTGPDRLFVGWGPFEQLPFRRPQRPAFFITDFFLDEAKPWWHPAESEEISVDELVRKFGEQGHHHPDIDWQPLSSRRFEELFESAQAGIACGDFKKIVPVVFEEGEIVRGNAPWRELIERLASLPRGLWAYGCSIGSRGFIGATPEVLFQSRGRGYSTMALAGTRPLARAGELLNDSKEMREHRIVVDDIVRRLAPFGNVEIGALGIMRLPAIAHLITPIFFMEISEERMSFADMVRRLHPTAALGVSPRTEAGERWLREHDRDAQRRTFGAPFGFEREERFAVALVSIRNIEWDERRVRIGSGAGIIAESLADSELEELRQKREQVKALFGLRVEAWT
ncbi:MAG: chorismate-binding protein [Thermoanaerobaculia bacterium]|nr:chorismate-binding protein [Thermoanaerobaculia bacterium]